MDIQVDHGNVMRTPNADNYHSIRCMLSSDMTELDIVQGQVIETPNPEYERIQISRIPNRLCSWRRSSPGNIRCECDRMTRRTAMLELPRNCFGWPCHAA